MQQLSQGDMDMDPSELNAPDYLFVSYQLARHYPHYIESFLVKQYRSQLPGAMGKAWQSIMSTYPSQSYGENDDVTQYVPQPLPHDVESNQQINKQLPQASHTNSYQHTIWPLYYVKLSLTYVHYGVIYIILQLIFFAPLELQSLLIRVIEPVVLSGVLFLILLVSSRPIFLALTIVLLVALVASMVWEHVVMTREHRRVASSVMDAVAYDINNNINDAPTRLDQTQQQDHVQDMHGAASLAQGGVNDMANHTSHANKLVDSNDVQDEIRAPSPTSWDFRDYYDELMLDEGYSMSMSSSSSGSSLDED
ncbi:hypothetical protein EON65_59265 [archaeon]|nr:MAG: hypothetical protein EON65_59265 [archaeon]